MLDLHVYQAWIPYGMRVPQALHLRLAACDAAAGVRAIQRDVLPVIVGEWSVALTDCAMWLNGVGLASGYANTNGPSADCARVPCPTRYNPLPRGASLEGGPSADGTCPTGPLPSETAPLGPMGADAFYALFTEYVMAAAEGSAGWLFWNFDNELGDPRWSFFAARERGWFPANLSDAAYAPRLPDCTAVDGVPIFGDFITAAVVLASCSVLVLVVAVAAWMLRLQGGKP